MRSLWAVVRSFRWREWGALVLASFLAVGAGVLGYVVVDAANDRQAATVQAQAQRDQAIDARQAQTRRIDQLTEQVDALRDRVESQARTIGQQEQAIRDLSAQVQDSGQSPVVTSVAPRRDTARTPAPKPGPTSSSRARTTSPTTAPKPTSQPTKAPAPKNDSPGLVCGLLPLIC